MLDETTILSLGLKEAWLLYNVKLKELLETGCTTKKDYDKARFGIKVLFEIEDYLDQNYKMKTKAGKIYFKNGQQYFNLTEFRTEEKERERIIRGALLEYYSLEEDIIKSEGIS